MKDRRKRSVPIGRDRRIYDRRQHHGPLRILWIGVEDLWWRFIGWVDLPGGGTMAMSSADLNVQEFTDYTTKVEAWAQTELGVCLMDLSEPHGRVA